MADEESGNPLRRWRPFYGAFGAIDDAIEAAAGHPRAAYRDMRVRILQMLRGAHDDDGKAEQLCATLDDVMAESLKSLLVMPVPHRALASTDLARAVGALRNHGSARIRGLASDVVRGWGVAIDGSVATAKEKLDKLSGDRIPSKDIPTVVTHGIPRGCVVLALSATAEVHEKKLHVPPAKMLPIVTAAEAHKKKLPAKIEAKKPVVAQIEKMEVKKPAIAQSEKMENTKRKLHEGYQEAERLKHQRITQRIDEKEAPKLLMQSQRKMHRGPARCRTSSCVRRSLLPSLQLI